MLFRRSVQVLIFSVLPAASGQQWQELLNGKDLVADDL